MKKIKVHVERDLAAVVLRKLRLSGIRQALAWILFILFFGLACFQAGYILRDLRADDSKDRILKLEDKFRNHDGRLIAVEDHKMRPRERRE
jgi:hypothetical protein